MSKWNPLTWGTDIVKQTRNGVMPDQLPQVVYVDGKFDMNLRDFTQEYSADAPALLNKTYNDLLYGAYNRKNFIQLFYCLPEIFAPINEIASRVADATWQLRKDWNDEIDYSNADFNRLFNSPNPFMTFKQFVYQSVCYEYLTGANIEYANKPGTLPRLPENILSWYNLPTDKVDIQKKKYYDIYSATSVKDIILGYKVGDRSFDIDNVLPFLNVDLMSTNDPTAFRSQLCGAELAIKNLLPVYEARGVIYVKRGALGFLVSAKSDESGRIPLNPKEKEDAQKVYQDSYGLRADKNQVGVSAAPVEFVKTSMSIQELQPFDETLADAVSIYATLKVPRHLVPTKDNSTFANAESDMKSFYANVIIPCANRYAQAWTNFFGFERRYIHADFSNTPELQENRKEKSEVDRTNGTVYYQRFTSGIMTLNEWAVAVDGEKSALSLYDKKIFEMLPDELELVKNILNLKSNVNTSENQGTQTQGSTNQLQ